MASSRRKLRPPGGITCSELVELLTDYLEDALDRPTRARVEAHLAICEGCTIHLAQLRETIRITGELREEELDPRMRDELLTAFRSWRPGA